ncbi:MAG: hypothetical protein A2W19_09270 [Spirochaetes bacterium RBG_16_49_21]|nr:MAG: hypothetical protein A2W19_09270 [Spirochaetes bacterium RBG_16_49_21]
MDWIPFYDKTVISDKVRSSNREKVNKSDQTSSRDAVVEPDTKKRESGGNTRERGDEARDHYESLKSGADLINSELEKKNSPYRFYLYREMDEIFIHLVKLDEWGEAIEVIRKNITHQEFAELISRLEKGEGLIIDSAG